MEVIAIESRDHLEQIWEEFQESRRIADRKVQPWQAALGSGDHFGRLVDGTLIVGEILEPEYPEDRARLQQPRLRNLRLAKYWSVLCLDGEMGTVHVAGMVPISKIQFDEALERMKGGVK